MQRKLHKNSGSPTRPLKNSGNHIQFTNLAPQTPTEHYWASRAQKAEALLAAREKHYEEIGRVREEESSKRNTELRALEEKLREKHSKLEKLLFVLVGIVVFLVALLVYLVTTSRNPTQAANLGYAVTAPLVSLLRWPTTSLGLLQHDSAKDRSGGRLNLHFHFPSHFTIPILSPWTSVVERQTSHVSSAAGSSSSYLIFISLLAVAASLVVYFHFSQRSSSSQKAASEHRSPNPSTGRIWQLLSPLLGAATSSSLLGVAWKWGYELLRLFGLVRR
ncbi:hypothetical protein D9756_006449 [Leucocoprinus leucothites]|uniref:Uncharacterized protein n=1 Tax=Leucocoprinus leucothites TaxID=201217 RepID=A0A8H5G203_9AGAR|nr:hypothetical protein D9756_006449 [Leucoagaricus leucothites]